MGYYEVRAGFHDDELLAFIKAAEDPGLAMLVRTGDLPESAWALASVAPYIAGKIRLAMGDDAPAP